MLAVIIRILLRYLAGALILKGLPSDMTDLLTDPDIADVVTLGLGVVIGLGSEGFYILARRFGWST